MPGSAYWHNDFLTVSAVMEYHQPCTLYLVMALVTMHCTKYLSARAEAASDQPASRHHATYETIPDHLHTQVEALRPLGLQLLQTVLAKFGSARDPLLPGQLLLEQFQAQFVSALR